MAGEHDARAARRADAHVPRRVPGRRRLPGVHRVPGRGRAAHRLADAAHLVVGADVRSLRRLLIVPLAAVALGTACGGGSTANNVSGTPAGTPSPAVNGNEVSIKETEYTMA